MAKNFGVEVLISTAKATKDLQAAEGQVRALDRSLANLSKTLKDSNGSLDAAAKSIASIVASSREAAKASEQLAAAKIKSSRADAQDAAATDRAALSAARLAREQAGLSNTLANTARQQTMAANTADLLARRQGAASVATDRMGNSLSNQRYLLYDVGATYRTLALAAQAIPAASLAVATSYEKSFAQVIRTSGATGVAVGELRAELKQLATEIPLSFAELSSIAKIGGQLGIPSDSLGKFTEVVAKFVATADGVTIDAATESFGRLANLFAQGFTADETSDFFNRIGAAISYTADQSVTSEAKISASLQKIAPIGKAAGLSAVEVTALASALSSVGLAPEISSGFLTRFFGQLNKDVAAGGDALSVYSKVLGITNNEFKDLYNNDPNAVLTGIVTELSKLDKISQTRLLGDIGITGVRDIRVIQGLSQNLHVLEQAQRDTADAFAKGTYLDTSSEGIFNTFAASLSRLASSFANLGDALGSSVLPVLSQVATGLNVFVQGFANLIETEPALRAVLGVLLGFASIAGVWLALKSAQAFVTAGLIGFVHATRQGVTGTGVLGTQIRTLAQAMLVAKGATDAQATAMLRGASATQALVIAQRGVVGSTNALSSSLKYTTVGANGFASTLKGIGGAALGLAGGPLGIAVTALGALGVAWLSASTDAKNSAQQIVAAFAQSGEAGAQALGETFAREKVGLFDSGSISLVGKSYQDVAKQAGASLSDIKGALSGSKADLDAYIAKLYSVRDAQIEAGDASPLDEQGRALDQLVKKLNTYGSELTTTESAAAGAKEANNGVATSLEDVGEGSETAELGLSDYISKLGEAAAAAFGLVDAQGAVEASLEKLGSGLQKSTSFGTDSEGGRNNLANLQATLVAQATLFQQNVTAGEITAEAAATQYAAFVQGLMSELAGLGVDTSQFEAQAQAAVNSVQGVFNSQVPEIPVVIADPVTENVVAALSDLNGFLEANPLAAQMRLAGGDETAAQVYDVVSYISSALGIPFEAVITALTNPAAEDSKAVIDFISNITSVEHTAVINADTSTAIGNIRNFAVYAQNQIGSVVSALAGATANPILGAVGAAMTLLNTSDVLATPAVNAAKANRALIPTFGGVKRGYADAAKSAGGAGKAAKGAGGAGKKAAKDLSKAAKDAKKDWDEAEQAIAGYASRIGTAFGYVFDKNQGVDVAKDEYYSVLNGIKERLEGQKQTLKDLRAENKALNAERRVQLNDAEKLEKMAKYADALGNTERAKYYRDEAKALKASADETKNKVDANNKEATAIEKGIGNLKGYTQAAIANRAELRTLEQASLNVAKAYASSGASAKTVREQTVIWTGKAKEHSKQLGYSRADIDKVTTSTGKYVTALGKVPKTIKTTITENKTTNLKANNQTASGVSGARKSLGSIPGTKNTNIKVGASGVTSTKNQIDSAAKNRNAFIKFNLDAKSKQLFQTLAAVNIGKPLYGSFAALARFNKGGEVPGFASGGTIPGRAPSDPTVDNRLASVDGQGMIAVRSGEFITQQPAVDYYGSDIMNRINNMDIPRYALGGQLGKANNNANQMGGVIDLSSETIQTLARMIEKDIYLYAGLEEIANSVNQGNHIIAQKGGHGVPK